MSILDALNEQQKKAGEKIEGPVLILAGAGSGKTRTITYRIAHMILEKGISPYSILAVTFTNKAAKEMKERVENLIGEDGKKIMLSTFHSFGLKLLRIYGNKIGYNPNFTIYDVDDQKKVIKSILKTLVVEDKDLTEGKIASIISRLKEDGKTPDDYLKENTYDSNHKIIYEVYTRYDKELRTNNGMDFSDILVNTNKLLDNSEILDKVQEKFKYIMVDEYQDTNNIQYQIVNKIAKKYKNICVVGDENQSIYGFRGANIQNILDFEKDYREATVIKLEENYRSTKVILEAANTVIRNNKSSKNKNLWTKKATGNRILLKACENGRQEVNFVIDEIKKLKTSGKRYNDFTILYRTNAQSRLFEEGFLREGIPYKIFGGIQFYQRAEIKDILGYLSVINNQMDGINLDRIINVPKRKIGEKTVEKIKNYALENNLTYFESLKEVEKIDGVGKSAVEKIKEFTKILDTLIEDSMELPVSELFNELIQLIEYKKYLETNYEDYETRIENIEELRNSIFELEKIVDNLTLREYLENVSLVSATDDLDEEKEYVKLMTIHNSKGLEFPIVFLVGLEDEVFPNTTKVLIDNEQLEEERRICYVAITRAEERLFLSFASQRYNYGKEQFMTPSRFIKEIPEDLIERAVVIHSKIEKSVDEKIYEKISKKAISTFENTKELKKSVENIKNNPYNIGDKVTHIKFGLGKVTKITEKKITVQFVDGEKDIALILASKFLKK
ncbi:MAG: UvrD-helicase domain-containing protein [Fusobacterium perfoetens]|uniref:ATP-dependent helicase n=1 Tax=Fusobacterium perfoetens TaxID=852 RepID=UPI0023F4D15D|nr:UvrD-helicase domain-containing protein [Fusobacterium perfoetens]MCI6151840.1 UvrD-helicase domain-containing protein [Fusobacterium perfoetens]MDY3236799.1 UvrD-helicase domain-containing protein [Fusobacterium perfoetens]